MKLGLMPAVVVASTVASITVVLAQDPPGPPTNLRITTGASSPTPPPPSPPPTPCVVPPAGGKAAHAYFDALAKRAEHLCNWSLRDQAQLNSLVADPIATFFSYNPASDAYADAQDAAKFYIPADGRASANTPGMQQLRMPVPKIDGGSLLVTWDWYWGPEFLTQRGGMNHYKSFKFKIGGHSIWTLMHSPAWADPGDIGKVWDSLGTPSGAPAGMILREPWTPAGPGAPDQRKGSGEQVGMHASTWMRYWVEWKMYQPPSAFTEWNAVTGQTLQPNGSDPQGRWHMVSMWYADENRAPQRLLYRIPVGWNSSWNPNITEFDFLMNTSQTSGFIGPWIGYGRNVVVLRDYQLPAVPETDKFIFVRPVR